MICGAAISPQFAVCAKCLKEHGLSDRKAEWPAWARQLFTDHRAQQRQERAHLSYDFVSLDGREGILGPYDELPSQRPNAYGAAMEQLADMGIEWDDD